MTRFADRCRRLMDARSGGVAVLHQAEGESHFRSVVLRRAEGDHAEEDAVFLASFLDRLRESDASMSWQGVAEDLLDGSLAKQLGWERVLVAGLRGHSGELLGALCLGDFSDTALQRSLPLLRGMIGPAAVSLENSRLFERIARSNRQWAQVFDSISDFIVVHDEQHRVVRTNQTMAEFLHSRPQELIGMHMRDLFARGLPVGMQPCPLCAHDGDIAEYQHPSLDRAYLLTTSKVAGAFREGEQTIHVLKDVTEIRQAERRYRELFDTVQEGVFFSTPEGRFVDVNDALVRMLGYHSREEMQALDLFQEFYADPGLRAEVMRLTERNLMQSKEVQLRRKNGAVIHALESAMAVRDASGRVVQYRGMILDITETKNFQQQLERQRDFNQQVLNNTQSMILVVDMAGQVTYANRRCYEAGHFEERELLGRRIGTLIAPADKGPWQRAFESVLMGDPVSNLEIQAARGDDSIGKFSVNLSPMRGEHDVVSNVVVVMTDITDLANIQAQLMHTEKMAAVGQLVSGVAHEVNNPLTAIMGFADLLLDTPGLPDSVRSDLEIIIQEAQRTKEIVQNLLSFARPRPPQRQEIDLNAVLQKTVALRSYDIASHGVEVVADLDPTVGAVIGDAHQLQQVFLNILNNAYDAVYETGRRGQIEISSRQKHGMVEVRFKDNGPGIVHAERIFDPFFTTKEIGKGTGLGLSICYGILRQHGGEITCHNNPGEAGATFVLRLPLRPEVKPVAERIGGESHGMK